MRAFGTRKNAAQACSTSPLALTAAEPPLPHTCRVQIWADQSTGLGAPEPGSKSKSATDSVTSTNAPAFTTAGSLTSPASISTSCRQRSRSPANNRRPQLGHRNRDADNAQQPKQIPRAAAGGGKRKIKIKNKTTQAGSLFRRESGSLLERCKHHSTASATQPPTVRMPPSFLPLSSPYAM